MDNIINLLDKIIVDGQEIDLQSLALINGTLNVGHQKDVIVEYIFKDETQIPSNMFKNLKQLKYAYFPKAGNIKTIGERAFANSGLSYIDNLSYVNYIGAQAFSYTKLTYVYNGDAPDSIAANAWSYIDTLNSDFKDKLLYKYPYIDFGNNSEPIINDDSDDPIINVTTNIINVTNNGGEYEITYTITNPVVGINISAITNVNWITNFNYNTSGKVKFTVNVQETNAQQRSATIILSYGNISKTITIIQAAGETIIVNNPIINISQSNINVENIGGEYTINYTITNPIQGSSIGATTSVTWINNFNYNTSGQVKFNVSAQETNVQQRSATITLSYPNANNVTITITQAAGEEESQEDTYIDNHNYQYYEEYTKTNINGNVTVAIGIDNSHINLIESGVIGLNESENNLTKHNPNILIGNINNTTAHVSNGSYTNPVILSPNNKAIFRFENYSSKQNNWNNFCVFIGGQTFDVNNLLVALRADNWENIEQSNNGITSNFVWDSFKDDLDGAYVKVVVTYTNNSLTIRCDIEPN